MTTQDDEIVAEIRGHREAHAASLDHDVTRITKDYQKQEQSTTRKVSRDSRASRRLRQNEPRPTVSVREGP